MDKSLADILVNEGGMAPDDVKDCAALAQDSSQSLDRLLVGKGYLQEGEMLKILGKYLAYPYRADLRDVEDQGRAALALEDGLLAEADVLARDPLEYRTGRPAASLASHGQWPARFQDVSARVSGDLQRARSY